MENLMMNPTTSRRRTTVSILSGLTNEQRQILDYRWGLTGLPPQTQPAIGAALGLRPGRVRSLELGAIRRLEKLRDPACGATLDTAARADLHRYGRFVAPGALPDRAVDPHTAEEWIAWLGAQLAQGHPGVALPPAEVEAVYDGGLAGCFGPRVLVALLCHNSGHPAAAPLADLAARATAQRPPPGWVQIAPTVWRREPGLSGGMAIEVWQAAGQRSGYTVVIKPRVARPGRREAPAALYRIPGPLSEALRQAETRAEGRRERMPELHMADSHQRI
jgi:hypothetical protein